MNYTKREMAECNCHIELIDKETHQVEIVYCPLHISAPAMYEALKAIKVEGTRAYEECQQDRPVRTIYDIDKVNKLAGKALAKAEGK